MRHAFILASGMILASCTASPPFAYLSGVMFDPKLAEISGIAASRAHPDVLWVLNDSDPGSQLFAVRPSGRLLATLTVAGVPQTDWEDLAAFDLGTRHYLLIADAGDNGGLRHTLELHVVEEPFEVRSQTVKAAWSMVFRWPDGPRDCEAVAVDVAHYQILLISKKRHPPELFQLPLRPRGAGILMARKIAVLAGVPVTSPSDQAGSLYARVRNQVTAADLSPDGRRMAVMTYHDMLLYRRMGNESWAQALRRAPQVHGLPWLLQAEALAWSSDGRSLFATGESAPAPLFVLQP